MSAQDTLTLFSIAGLLIAFVSSAIPQFFKTSEESGHRKYLTPAGMIALSISALGLLTAISAALLGLTLRHQEELEAEREEKEAAQQLADEKAAARQRANEEKLWRERSDELSGRILRNTDRQLKASEEVVAGMLSGFRESQLQQQRTIAELQQSTNRILLPVGRLTYTGGVQYRCDDGEVPPPCAVKSRIRQGVRSVSSPADLVDPDGPPITMTLIFVMPAEGARLNLRSNPFGSQGIKMYGRIRSTLRPGVPRGLGISVLENGLSYSYSYYAPEIPPYVSREVSSMLDLQGQTMLLWSPDLAQAESMRFSVFNEALVQLGADCVKAEAVRSRFVFADDEYRNAFACTFGTID